jgi:hypothetical protein
MPAQPRSSNRCARRTRRHASWRATAAALLATTASTLAGTPGAAISAPVAHAAHRLTGTATAHLKLRRANGKTLIESGSVSGALTGSVQAELRTGATFTATFTIHTRSGSMTGHGQAKPSGRGRFESFRGSFSVTSGSGRYAHIHGNGGLYGTLDNRTDDVIIQAVAGQIFY